MSASSPGRSPEAWRNAGPLDRRGAGPAHSLGLFEDLHDPPPLGGGERTGLHQQNPVADAARVLLVVHLELAGATQNLAVEGVLDAVLDFDDDGLVHLVADHQSLADLPGPTGRGRALVTHAVPSSGMRSVPSLMPSPHPAQPRAPARARA